MGDNLFDLEQLNREDRLWEMGTPGGAAIGGKPKKRSDYGKKSKTLQEYNAESGSQPFATGSGSMMFSPSGGVPIFGPAEQRQIASDMAKQTMAAFDKENYSRVAQGREMRRMAHEQELARINAQAGMFNAQADRDAALIRALLAD